MRLRIGLMLCLFAAVVLCVFDILSQVPRAVVVIALTRNLKKAN